MTHALVKTLATLGLGGQEITIEADANKAIPTIEIIGLPDAAIKESKERIRATFRNLNIILPTKKIVLNLAPSDIRKVGTQFDLPMATAILFLIHEQLFHKDILEHTMFFGELGLDGAVKKVQGVLSAVLAGKKLGYTTFFISSENIFELQYIPGIVLYPISSFLEIVDFFIEGKKREPFVSQNWNSNNKKFHRFGYIDFSAIQGHLVAKRALMIAAAGGHNVLLIGAPGSGKTLLSQALPSILPPLQFEEMIEISQIYSLVGKLTQDQPLMTQRPYRPIHHTASKISITGGGALLQPGEISLAHKGILFFDELPEFPREVIEVLRQPLEDKMITISRASGSVSYPAHFMFVAAMNPCKCGYYKDPQKSCVCGLAEIVRYQSKISGPLLDRIDLIVEIPRESVDIILDNNSAMSSELLLKGVLSAREIQQKRYAGTNVFSNAGLRANDMSHYVFLDEQAEQFLKQASQKFHFSGRVVHRLMKVARTIADIEGDDNVSVKHLAEAMHYRSKNMFIERQ